MADTGDHRDPERCAAGVWAAVEWQKPARADVAAIREQVALVMQKAEPLQPADMYGLVAACLALRALPDNQMGDAAPLARQIAQKILTETAGWTEPAAPLALCADWESLLSAPYAWREEVVARLARAPSVLPKALKSDLVEVLGDLNSGFPHQDELLVPHQYPGRGWNPPLARRMEENLIAFVAWNVGCGAKAGAELEKVARLVHRDRKAIEAWRLAMNRRYGQATVRAHLRDYEEMGRSSGKRVDASIEAVADLWLIAARSKKARRKAT